MHVYILLLNILLLAILLKNDFKTTPPFFLKLKLFNDTFDYEIISGLFSNSNKYTTSITLSVLCTCTSFERFGIYILCHVNQKRKQLTKQQKN